MDIKGIRAAVNTSDLESQAAAEEQVQPTPSGIAETMDKVEAFDAKKHFTGVQMQQGRVQTDDDWNENQNVSLEDGVVVDFMKGDENAAFTMGDLWDLPSRRREEPSTTDTSSTSDPDDKP